MTTNWSDRMPGTLEDFIKGVLPARVCMHTGCENLGNWVPTIQVWAKGGDTRSPGQSFTMILDLMVCDQHKNELNPDAFWTNEGRSRVKTVLKQMGKAPPDFKTTKIIWNQYKIRTN